MSVAAPIQARVHPFEAQLESRETRSVILAIHDFGTAFIQAISRKQNSSSDLRHEYMIIRLRVNDKKRGDQTQKAYYSLIGAAEGLGSFAAGCVGVVGFQGGNSVADLIKGISSTGRPVSELMRGLKEPDLTWDDQQETILRSTERQQDEEDKLARETFQAFDQLIREIIRNITQTYQRSMSAPAA